MRSEKNETLRFLHIPKCGGSTFAFVLLRQYKGQRNFSFSGNFEADRARYSELKKQDPNPFSLFRGHAPIETAIEEANSGQIITLFRDPISRVKSFCQHVSEGKSPHLVERFPPFNFDLDAFLESGSEEISNLQTKMMINSSSCMDKRKIDTLGEVEAVELALRNLDERVAVFGLVEHYDESLIHMAEQLGWRLPLYAKKNVKSERKRLTFEARHLDKIRELNAIDLQLYAQVKKLFEERYQLTPKQEKQLKRQRFFNKWVMPAYESGRMKGLHIVRSLLGRK